jgi:hypothetical protein
VSIRAMDWVFSYSEATLGSRLVLLALADFAHDDGTNAYPSVETIAKKARLSPRGARAALRKLEEEGHVERTGISDYGTAIYRVLVGGAEVSSGGKFATENVSSSSANPSSNPSEETSPKGESKNESRDVFEHWLERMGKNGSTRLTAERRRAIEARVREGYSVERIKRAVDGCAGSDFHMGRHEKTRGRPQNDLTLICRNGSKLETFEAMPPPGGGERSAYDRIEN